MKADEFARELDKIETDAWDRVRDLVQRAQTEEGLEWDTDKRVSFHDAPIWQYKADGFAELGGWIYDRLNGINRLHRKSMTKKIRRALGYTNP